MPDLANRGVCRHSAEGNPQVMGTVDDIMMLEYFHLFKDSSEDPHFLANPAGDLLAANPAACIILGRKEEELARSNLAELVTSPEAARRFVQVWARTTRPLPEPLTLLGSAGQHHPTFCHGSMIEHQPSARRYLLIHATTAVTSSANFIETGKALQELQSFQEKLLVSSRDLQQEVVEHGRTKARLHETLSSLTSILDQLEAIVYAADPETHELLFVNRCGRRAPGVSTGRLCWQTVPPLPQQAPCCSGPAPRCRILELQEESGRCFQHTIRTMPWGEDRMVRLGIIAEVPGKTSGLPIETENLRLEALWRLDQLQFTSESDFIGQALEEAVKFTGSKSGYLHLPDAGKSAGYHCWPEALQKEGAAPAESCPPRGKDGLWADGRPSLPDCQPEPATKGASPGHFPLKSHLRVPVSEEGKLVAVVGVEGREAPYALTDARDLALFGHLLWRRLNQKRLALEAHRAREAWELTFDAIDEVVTLHDQEMRIIRANRATGRLLGVEPSELLGRPCYEVLRNGSKPCIGCPELLAHADLQSHEATICHENLGKVFLVCSSPLIDQQGNLLGFIHMAKDVTRQRVLEEKLQHTQKMEAIGVLAGGIAHDFNNILSPIVGYADLALNRAPATSGLIPYLQQIHRAAHRARELVQQILAFGRQAPQEKKPLQLHLMINEALKLLRSTLPSTLEIRQNLPDCGMVLADPIQVHQIVMNLATNAAHAMKEKGGTLGVRLTTVEMARNSQPVVSLDLSPGSYLLLEVSDTGYGMSAEVLKRVFEPYFTTKKMGEGSGLGLAVVHGIVESHGGHVAVESQPGKGSTFRVYLPRHQGEISAAVSALQRPLPGGSERLLIVDDEEVIVPMLREMLQDLGYSVTISNDSIDTWELFRKHPFAFDLLITDMAMPGLTGLALTKKVQSIRPGMPIILCTGYSELLDADTSRAAGIGAFLVKPISMRELAETIRKVLAGKS